MNQDIIITLTGVSKCFKDQMVLSNVDLIIEDGAIVFISGSNGSGKSLLLKIISGIMNPSKGTVEVCHKTVGNGKMAPNTGIMIDRPAFAPNLSALQNLLFISSNNDRTKVKRILNRIGLFPEDRRPVRKYSMGMKQKVGLAIALVDDPKVLLLDEPFSNLDDDSIAIISELLVDINRKTNTTILLTGHTKEDILCFEKETKVTKYTICRGTVIRE